MADGSAAKTAQPSPQLPRGMMLDAVTQEHRTECGATSPQEGPPASITSLCPPNIYHSTQGIAGR